MTPPNNPSNNPSNNPLNPEDIEAYLLGQLPADQVTQLDQQLRSDPQALRQLSEAIQIMSLVRQEFSSQAQYQAANDQEPLLDDFNTLLKELGQLEASAQPVAFPVVADTQEVVEDAGSLSRHDLVAAGSYLFRHALQSKPLIMGTAAAIVLLATVLILTWGDSGNANLAEQSPEVTSPASTDTSVATLTAQQDARWAERALVSGSALHAGQTLTLTQGTAEITTNDGAIAILQAPTTIQLIDNDNALRLHAGKLVGICETESSKGFLVRTPHMDVTDLGTRFGVDVNEQAMTEVHVIQGSVEVSSPAQGQDAQRTSQRLTSGYAALASDEDMRIRSTIYQPNRFSATGLSVTALVGTGLGLKPDEVDVNWQIVAIDGNRLDQPQALRVNKLHRLYAKPYPNDPATSQWISWQPPRLPIGRREGATTAYHFQTQIELPASFNPSTDRVVARCMADDLLQSIAVNGQAVEVPYQKAKDDPDAWFKESYEIVIDHQLVAGQNTIEFVLLNGHTFKDHVGLRIAWEVQTNSKTLTRGQIK